MSSQLSIYDKLRHHSEKDFTCSVGKNDCIYITFRHKTWMRFTSTEYISVYIGKGGALKFGDPKNTKMLAPCFKLQQNQAGYEETKESTRYLKITGKKYPAILDIVKRCAGSYDFPPEPMTEEESTALGKKIAKEIGAKFIEEGKTVVVTSEPTKLRAYTKEQAEADAFMVRRNLFLKDLSTLTGHGESTEERIAIINALAALYGRNTPVEKVDVSDPWQI